MSRFGLTNRRMGAGHLTDEELLLHLDGELPAKRGAEVQRHLQSCWQCRVQSEKVERAISELVDARNASHAEAPPPGDWLGFEARLSQAAREAAAEKPAWWSFPIPVRPLGFAALCAVAVACTVWWLASSPKVSAHDALTRAELAERSEVRGAAEPVIYQKVRVRHRARDRQYSADLESWTDWSRRRVARRGNAEAWRDLDQALRTNRMTSRPLLSPAAFLSWRDSLPSKKDQVVRGRLQNGSEALIITTSIDGVVPPGSIREAQLVLRTADWHSVQQSLRVGPEADSQEFDFTELAFDVRPYSSVNPALFGEPPRLTPPPAVVVVPRVTPPVLVPEPAPPDPDELTVRALHALHTAGACLREQVEILRGDDGSVRARGVTETAGRKAELTGALREAGLWDVEIDTAEEAMRKVSTAVPADRQDPAPTLTGELKSGKPPVADLWKDRLNAVEMTRLSNSAVALSEEWLAHAVALSRLQRQFPAEREGRLRPASAMLLGEMVRDHSGKLRQSIESLQAALAPFRTAAPGTGADDREASLRDAVGRLEGEAAEARSLTLHLFAGSGPAPADVEEMIGRLVDSLSSMQARSLRLEAAAGEMFRSGRESVEAGSRRIP